MRLALVRTYQPMLVDDLAHPLGIMSLDAYLRTKGHDDIRLYDMRLAKETPAQACRRILADRPDVVGLSGLTIERDAIHALAKLIKQAAPHVVTVLGGPYPTSSTRSVMADPSVDYAVVGEGEETLHELLTALAVKGDPARVDGLIFRREGLVVQNPPRVLVKELDAMPIPSWDRIDMDAYERFDSMERLTRGRWAVIATSRGCPFKCTYCHDVFGKKFRARSPAKVIEEMELLITRYGVTSFQVYDDIFNFNKKRVLEICALIVAKGWKIDLQFPNGVRADMMDLEMLAAMKAAGTWRVSYAIESASPRIQKQVKKHLKIDKVRQLIEDTDRMGILAHGFFMLGFPGETRAEVDSTVRFALDSRLHSAGFFLVTPFEGSPLADAYVDPAKDLHGGQFNYYDNPHSLSEVPADELKVIQRNAYLRFYLDPRRIARFARLVPRKRELLKLVPVFVKLVAGKGPAPGADAHSFDHGPEAEHPVEAPRPPAPAAPERRRLPQV